MTGKALTPAPRYSAVERGARASPPPVPSWSGGLKSGIADSLNLRPIGEGGQDVWVPPSNLPARICDEAARAAKQLEHALRPASAEVKGRWLSQLAQLVAPGRDSAPDMLARINALRRDLDHPPLCFTDDTRIIAAKKFMFLPSFAELAGLLDGIRQPYRDRLERLRRLGPAQQPERAENDAEMHARRHDRPRREKAGSVGALDRPSADPGRGLNDYPPKNPPATTARRRYRARRERAPRGAGAAYPRLQALASLVSAGARS